MASLENEKVHADDFPTPLSDPIEPKQDISVGNSTEEQPLSEDLNAWRHEASLLIHGCVSYSCHYLGSVEIKNLEGTTDSKIAIQKLKVSPM